MKKTKKRGGKSTRRRHQRRTLKRGGRAVRPSGSNNQQNGILYTPNTNFINENSTLETTLDNLVNTILDEEGYELIKDELSDMIYIDVMGFEKHKGYGLGRYQTFEEFEPHVRSSFHLQAGEYEPLLRKIFELYSYLSLIQSLDDDGEEVSRAHEYLQSIGFSN